MQKQQSLFFFPLVIARSSFRTALTVFLFLLLLMAGGDAFGQRKRAKPTREYMALNVYHATNAEQVSQIENYLQFSLLPLLQKNGFSRTGVFTMLGNDTAAGKKIFVLVPFRYLLQFELLNTLKDKSLLDSGNANSYARAAYNKPPYSRMETILLRAFAGMPEVKAPTLKGQPEERIYELRSYESATEALHQNKVKMFNEGEVQLFERLGFNAVFYGQVLAGARMPNLMYITSFDNKASRDEHWKTFGSDPEWKKMSAMPEYQNNVSRIDITFLRPTTYSRL